ncbi:MAG: YdcF family protein [Bacteroidota bacterium]
MIKEDSLQQADALFVLSGAGYERGNEAAKIFKNGFVPKVVCTGANLQVEFKVFNIDTLESDVTVANLKRLGLTNSQIVKIPEGTSTREESNVILDYCLKNNLKRIMIVSSKMHTRRVGTVFREKFENAGILLIVRGAPPLSFDEMRWWQHEDGMIGVNNEWMKTIYYWLKY